MSANPEANGTKDADNQKPYNISPPERKEQPKLVITKKEYPTYDKEITSYATFIEALNVTEKRFEMKKLDDLLNLLKEFKNILYEKFYDDNMDAMAIYNEIITFINKYNFNSGVNQVFIKNIKTSFVGMIFLLNLPFKAFKLGKSLFKMAFIKRSIQGKDFPTFLPIIEQYKTFIYDNSPVMSFQCVTGSGKTRCVPFLLAIRSAIERLRYPFIIMTQPGKSIVQDKLIDFKNYFSEEDVIIKTEVEEIIDLLDQDDQDKPIVCIMSPIKLLELLKYREDLHEKTRFVLDEVHERPIYLDVLISTISQTCDANRSLQIVMMTATPDIYINNCFECGVKEFSIKEETMYKVDTYEYHVEKSKDISAGIVMNLLDILQSMDLNRVDPGHILIFTSGNSRIREIISILRNEFFRYFNQLSRVRLVTNVEQKLLSKEEFYANVQTICPDPSKLYVIPIPYASYLSEDQKFVAKYNIDGYPNIIKVVIATDAIESSVTIDDLYAVIDGGICNAPEFDPMTGLTSLHEVPISVQSQQQRKGRVGRVRPGRFISVDVYGSEHPYYSTPVILNTDISGAIIDLRYIGYEFENINNLPNPIDQRVIDKTIRDLVNCGALENDTHNLTDAGIEIKNLYPISPLMAASILMMKEKYNPGIDFEHSQEYTQLLACLILLIAGENIIVETTNPFFVDCFCDDSDLVTVIRSLFKFRKMKGKEKDQATQCGFNQKSITNVFGKIREYAKKLDIDYDDQKDMEFWESFEHYFVSIDFMKFVSFFVVKCISKNFPEWISTHQVKFNMIYNVLENPMISYFGGKDLKFDKYETLIEFPQRIGATKLVIPKSGFVWSIIRNTTTRKIYGQYIHKFGNETVQIQSIPIEDYMDNEMFLYFMELYIEPSVSKYVAFGKGKYFGKNSKIHFFTTVVNNIHYVNFQPEDRFVNIKSIDSIITFMKSFIKVAQSSVVVPSPSGDFFCMISKDNSNEITTNVVTKNTKYAFDVVGNNYLFTLSRDFKIVENYFGNLIFVFEDPSRTDKIDPFDFHFWMMYDSRCFSHSFPKNFFKTLPKNQYNEIPLPKCVLCKVVQKHSIESAALHKTCARIGKQNIRIKKNEALLQFIERMTNLVISDSLLESEFKLFLFNGQKIMRDDSKTPLYEITVNCPQYLIPKLELTKKEETEKKEEKEKESEFVKIMNIILNKFGRIILRSEVGERKAVVEIISSQFAAAFINEIDFSFLRRENSQFNLPSNIPNQMIKSGLVIEPLMAWFKENKFDIKISESGFVGPSRVVYKANKLFEKSPPVFQFTSLDISFKYDIKMLDNYVKKYNSEYNFEHQQYKLYDRILIIPNGVPMIDLTKFISENSNIEIICSCSNPVISRYPLYIDGSQPKHFCVNCMRKSLQQATNSDNCKTLEIIHDLRIPFGRLINTLNKEDSLRSSVKNYLNKIATKSFKECQELISCPVHPDRMFVAEDGAKCTYPGCKKVYMSSEKNWIDE